jgi:hypothetical protein
MKIRVSFVSNSSSASFVLNRRRLTPEQEYKIINYLDFIEEMNMEYKEYIWQVTVSKETIELSTWLDNFDMKEYLEKIGVSNEVFISKRYSG